MASSRQRNEASNNGNTYPLGDMKTGGKTTPDIYGNISPSESQEQIIKGGKIQAHVTTSRSRSGSTSGSEDLVLQGITVTTDVKISRN